MSDSTVLFTDIRLNNKLLSDCEMALETGGGYYRLYIDKCMDSSRFYCVAVEFAESTAVDDCWNCSELRVTELFAVIALFDGVRHLEFNSNSEDMAGYIYYPDIQGVIDLLQKVREIELEVCGEWVDLYA